MATYYGTYGQKVQYLASDPSDPQIGQVWYNSTSATLKVRGFTTTNSWASASNYPGSSRSYPGGFGTQTAAVMAGGYNGPAYLNEVGLYTGSTWTTGNVLPYVGGLFAVGGIGTQTAGLIAGGEPGTKNTTLEFDGTNWSSGGNLNTARYWAGAAGLQTAGLIFGGEAVPGKTDATESYNGTAWTTLPATTTVTNYGHGAGTQTAALYFGGLPSNNQSQKYNGSTWTNTPNLNTGRYGGASFGTQTVAVLAGGQGPSGQTTTETWNGTSWTTNTALPSSRQYMGGAGIPGGQGITFGGDDAGANPRPAIQTTQLWNGAYEATQTVTVS